MIFVAVNVIAGTLLRSARLDLTANHLYTLNSGTRAMLKKLKEPVTLRLYFSERLAANYQSLSAYGIRVRDLVSEMTRAAGGKLILDTVDPEPFSPEEELAESYGLTGAQTETGEKLYLGLVGTNLVDGMETIPFLSPEREEHLEYDVGALVHALAAPEKLKLGILTGLPLEYGPGGIMAQMQGQPAQPYVVYEQLKKSFDVEMLKDDVKAVPPEIGALLIAHPVGLKPQALYAIDQFAMRGGRLLVLVDPMSESSAGPGQQGPSASDLGPLLAAWGVKYDPKEIVLDKGSALSVQYGYGGSRQPIPYLAWLRLTGDSLDKKDLIVSDIQSVQIASAGHLDPIPGATTKFQPLLQTSRESQAVPSMVLAMGGDPPSLLEEFKSENKRFTLAARVTGPVKSAYPAGPPAAEPPSTDAPKPAEPEAPLPAHIAESKAPLNLILIADSDMLEDRFWVSVQDFLGQRIAQPNSGNGYLIVNAADNLLGSEDLISLRSRERSDRPFTVVKDLESRARDQYRAEEDKLKTEIADTEERLKALQAGKKEGDGALGGPQQGAGASLTPEEAKEVKRFQVQLADSRRKLREVQRELRADVIELGNWVKLVNIALVPVLVAIAALVLADMRRRRRYRARASGAGG
ncbi:MAG: Gldg family protein [Alphaproteobacteria bacterium]